MMDIRHCTRCVMDSSALGIAFDVNGECNFCKLHDKLDQQFPLNPETENSFFRVVQKIKEKGKGKKFDCIVGVSGGRDSTYLLYSVKKKWGLRPLAVHFNDGFDNPIAGENIRNSIQKLDVELRTITSDWRESKAIRIAFLKASTPNLEVGTDLGYIASLYGTAVMEKIPYIFTGHSFRTEGIAPLSWSYVDGKYLKTVLKTFEKMTLRKWRPQDPSYNLMMSHLFYYIIIKRIQFITPFYYVRYVRSEIEPIITQELNWVNTGAHYYDDLYQSLISYVYRIKFNVDKRKFNYSALVRSKQMTRKEALERLKNPYVIEDPKVISLCIKRLGITQEQFDEFISYPPKLFFHYPTYYSIARYLKLPIKLACNMRLIPAGTYDKLFSCI